MAQPISTPDGPSPDALRQAALDREERQARELRRHRAIATGLLVVMVAIVAVTIWFPGRGFWIELIQAAAIAGFVGGIADWFAVTALFRRPLGLPIPHTEIIPRQRARIGQGLGRFVAGHIITETEIRGVLDRLDLARIIAEWLADPRQSRPAAEQLARGLPRLMDAIEGGGPQAVLLRLVPARAARQAADLLALAARPVIASGIHRAAVAQLVRGVSGAVRDNRGPIREALAKRLTYVPSLLNLDRWLADKVIAEVLDALEAGFAPEGVLTNAAHDWLSARIGDLATSVELRGKVRRAALDLLRHEAVRALADDAWRKLRAVVEADAAASDGRIAAAIAEIFAATGRSLAEDAAARERLNAVLRATVVALLPTAQARISGFIESVVSGWDAHTVARRIELAVGKDLQFVRINGTLVGALVGGCVFAALHWLQG